MKVITGTYRRDQSGVRPVKEDTPDDEIDEFCETLAKVDETGNISVKLNRLGAIDGDHTMDYLLIEIDGKKHCFECEDGKIEEYDLPNFFKAISKSKQ